MVNERDLRPSLPQIPRRAHAQIERTPQQRTSGANWRCTLRSGRERWCRLGDLNTRPSHYECDALPAELRRHGGRDRIDRSEEHTSELQSLMRISYAVFCLKKKNQIHTPPNIANN